MSVSLPLDLRVGWEIVCPDGRVRHYPYGNEDDAVCDCDCYNDKGRCTGFYPEPGPLELLAPPCPSSTGPHVVRPCAYDARPTEDEAS